MAQKTAARGRPKGTGLDDAGPLAAMAELIAANPGMKPTTAIKSLGITDPSTVRRLRDKYQQRHAPRSAAPTAAAARSNPPLASNVIALRTRVDGQRREAPAAKPTQPAQRAEVATSDEAVSVSDDHPAASAASVKPDLLAAAYAASIATAKTAIHLHYKSLWFAFYWSPVAFALRNTEYTRLVLSSLKDKD